MGNPGQMQPRSRFALVFAVLAGLVAVFALSVIPGKVQAQDWGDHAIVQTYNHTRYESWVDISWTYLAHPWNIEKAFCLKPGQSYTYRVALNHPTLQPQIRVRAEIKLAGCAHGTHTVVHREARVVKGHETLRAVIAEPANGYFQLWFPD